MAPQWRRTQAVSGAGDALPPLWRQVVVVLRRHRCAAVLAGVVDLTGALRLREQNRQRHGRARGECFLGPRHWAAATAAGPQAQLIRGSPQGLWIRRPSRRAVAARPALQRKLVARAQDGADDVLVVLGARVCVLPAVPEACCRITTRACPARPLRGRRGPGCLGNRLCNRLPPLRKLLCPGNGDRLFRVKIHRAKSHCSPQR
mmetsp:Transcript_39058/g.121758  ORF Transcript_39058/g.121758 Transcript_39058/m.121758 type:complete len:203 (+) Transcript_39058:911-1519(+)